MKKVEIGPGMNKIDPSWITVGPYKAPHIDYVCMWGTDTLPFDDNSIDLVYTSHCLEHILWYDTVRALKDTYRVLRPGGQLEIHVPDFEVIVKAYLNKKSGDAWRKYNPENDHMTWINGRVFTYGDPETIHKAVFDKYHLTNCVIKAGFKKIINSAPVRGHNHGIISLSITAIKEPQ